MTLPANFCLRALIEENSLVVDLSELVTVSCLLHDGVTADAADAAACVRTRLPIGLHAFLMAGQTGGVLLCRRLIRVFAESDQAAHAFSAASGDVIASGSVTVLAGLLLSLVARIEQKNFPHHRLGKFFKLSRMTGLAD